MYSTTILTILAASAAGVSATRQPILRHPHASTSYNDLFGRASETCSNPQTSCQNTTAVSNLCCFNAPGGLLLQTQFWDTDPVTGPSDSWTIHGLWPDNCDGTFQEDCDSSRAYTDIGTIIKDANSSLYTYLTEYWQSNDESDEAFWEHEWSTHGTCISTLDPDCYTNYQTGQEVVDFAERLTSLFQSLPSYTWLSNAGITPSSSKTYTSSAIAAALKTGFGQTAYFDCDDGELSQIYYYYNVKGSVQSGTFIPVAAPDSGSCPSSGIKYLPKSGASATATDA